MSHKNQEPNVCCPPFDTTLWDDKTSIWEDKLFIKDTIPQIFHMPLPGKMNKTITSMWNKAIQSSANPELNEFLLLAYDPSPWKSEFYMSVTKEVEDAENVKLSGRFLSKVFDGPYNAVPKWISEMEEYVASKGYKTKKYYFYYTTCPKCAKIHGHNYVVAFSEVE